MTFCKRHVWDNVHWVRVRIDGVVTFVMRHTLIIRPCLHFQIRIIVSQQISCGNNFGLTQQELVLRKEIRMFKMTGTLLGYFAFAWMPFVIFEFTSILGEKEINKWIR